MQVIDAQWILDESCDSIKEMLLKEAIPRTFRTARWGEHELDGNPMRTGYVRTLAGKLFLKRIAAWRTAAGTSVHSYSFLNSNCFLIEGRLGNVADAHEYTESIDNEDNNIVSHLSQGVSATDLKKKRSSNAVPTIGVPTIGTVTLSER